MQCSLRIKRAILVGVLLLSFPLAVQAACKTTRSNLQGVAGADIVVGQTAILVLATNAQRCSALIINTSLGARARCMPIPQGNPTATSGTLLNSGFQLRLGSEGVEAWQCISADVTNATVMVVEALP